MDLDKPEKESILKKSNFNLERKNNSNGSFHNGIWEQGTFEQDPILQNNRVSRWNSIQNDGYAEDTICTKGTNDYCGENSKIEQYNTC